MVVVRSVHRLSSNTFHLLGLGMLPGFILGLLLVPVVLNNQVNAQQIKIAPISSIGEQVVADGQAGTQVKTTPIKLGTVIPGILDSRDARLNGYYLEAYKFSGQAGTPVQIQVKGSKDYRKVNNLSLTPYVLLYGPGNRLIARTNAAPGTVDAFIRMKLPETGEYTVVFTGTQPQKAGRYWLVVQYAPIDLAPLLTTEPQTSERPISTVQQSKPSASNEPNNSHNDD